MKNDTQGASAARTAETVDWDGLNRLFAQMPSGPWDASRHGDGHEIRQIDTDPTNKHHWPFRLCQSISGQRAACDDAVFDFLAGVLNAWPQIVAERSETAQVERIEALSKRAAGGEWFVTTNGADGLARIDNGTDAMFPVRCEWHEAEFIKALVNAYRNGDVVLATATPAPATPPGVPDSVRALSEAFAETACCASCTTPMDCYQGKPCRLEPVGSGSGVVDHEFKSHPDVFWPAARGEKTFEYRRDDRGGYEVGQTVRLRCYDLTRGYHDTAPLDRRITNILRGGEFELPMGYCILSLAPLAAQPAGQSAGSGAGVLAATLTEFQRRNGYHRREIEELLTEFGELLLSKVQPAPDSTRTGPVGTEEWVSVPAEPTEEMIAAGWIDKEDVDPDDIYRAMIAVRPASPEAQGAWRLISTAPKDGTHIIAHDEHYGVCEAVWRNAFDDLAEEPFEGLWDLNHSALNEATGWQPMPDPPSSGQEG